MATETVQINVNADTSQASRGIQGLSDNFTRLMAEADKAGASARSTIDATAQGGASIGQAFESGIESLHGLNHIAGTVLGTITKIGSVIGLISLAWEGVEKLAHWIGESGNEAADAAKKVQDEANATKQLARAHAAVANAKAAAARGEKVDLDSLFKETGGGKGGYEDVYRSEQDRAEGSYVRGIIREGGDYVSPRKLSSEHQRQLDQAKYEAIVSSMESQGHRPDSSFIDELADNHFDELADRAARIQPKARSGGGAGYDASRFDSGELTNRIWARGPNWQNPDERQNSYVAGGGEPIWTQVKSKGQINDEQAQATKDAASQGGADSFNAWGAPAVSAYADALTAAIAGTQSLGGAIKDATAQSLKALGAEFRVRALGEGAKVFAALAVNAYPAAASHAKAAAGFLAASIAAGAAGGALGGGGGGGAGGSAGAAGGGFANIRGSERVGNSNVTVNIGYAADDARKLGTDISRALEAANKSGRTRGDSDRVIHFS